MDGRIFAEVIEKELKKRGISKGQFYEDLGITATAMYGWKNGATPKKETVSAVEEYLGIDFPASMANAKNETLELAEILRDRQDLRILLRSAKDVPASSVYQLIAQVEKWKEES